MRDLFTVMMFTMKEMIRRKSFIISSLIIILMIIVGFNVPNIINAFNEDKEQDIIVSDPQNIYENHLVSIKNIKPDYEYVYEPLTIDEIKDRVKNDENVKSGIYISKENKEITITYIVENAMFSDEASLYTTYLKDLYKDIKINKLDVSDEMKMDVLSPFGVNVIQTDEEAKGNVIVMMLASLILFYAVYFCAYQVSSSITTEKTSKIIETLVTSTSPKNIVLGKTFGIGLVGLIQLTVFLAVGVISGNTFMDKELLSQALDTSTITWGLGLITLLYFLLGYLTYALLYALTGSTISKPEDIQSANSPVALITVIGFYLSYFTMMNPASNLNKLAGLLPISSPFCMPFRVMMQMSSPLELLLSISILVVTIILIAHITIRIYSNAILNYGTKVSLKAMYKQK